MCVREVFFGIVQLGWRKRRPGSSEPGTAAAHQGHTVPPKGGTLSPTSAKIAKPISAGPCRCCVTAVEGRLPWITIS